ncbi:MAG: hypothetical protein VKK05_09365 [Synechococcus sp.]|nr:hypothetical protein [Synechococcus sp.]
MVDENVNIIRLKTETVFDHTWLRDTVESFQTFLLSQYRCVIFAEIDEFIYTSHKKLNETIDEFVEDTSVQYQTVLGYDIIQNDQESYIINDTNTPMMQNRSYRVRRQDFDKTLITKMPIKYAEGFHEALNIPHKLYKYQFKLAHLHKIDKQMLLQRHKDRLTFKTSSDIFGQHNKTTEDEYLLNAFYYANNHESMRELIPEADKQSLKML